MRKQACLAVLAVLVVLVAACGESPTGPGRLSVAVTGVRSSPAGTTGWRGAPAVEAVIVKVVKVRAHSSAAGWVEVSDTPFELDLLALATASQQLGLAKLPAGKVTQLRLVLARTGNRIVAGGHEFPLFVPGGDESGIKIHGPWDVVACGETAIVLSLDHVKSIWYHPTGSDFPWILRPVIHALEAELVPGTCEPEGGGEAPACVPDSCPSKLCDEAGRCAPGGAGVACQVGEECLSGTCTASLCEPSGPTEPCRVAGDCDGGTCEAGGTCAPGAAGGAGAICTTNAGCLSNACVAGLCSQGGQAVPCSVAADCQEGFICSNGACAVPR